MNITELDFQIRKKSIELHIFYAEFGRSEFVLLIKSDNKGDILEEFKTFEFYSRLMDSDNVEHIITVTDLTINEINKIEKTIINYLEMMSESYDVQEEIQKKHNNLYIELFGKV